MKIRRLSIEVEDGRTFDLWDFQIEALLELAPVLRNLERLKEILDNENLGQRRL